MKKKSGPNMSAALAIAIERQVDGIIAAAKTRCTLGGLVLWVGVRDDAEAARALEILIKAGARDAHLHEIQRESLWKNRPATLAQPDPFLERESVGP